MINNIVTWPYRLRRGHSDNPEWGACAMDAVNWLVHGKHGDKPECACPVIGEYVIKGNDSMPADVRQHLLAYLPRIAGSRSPKHEAERLRVLVLAAVRVFLPIVLKNSGLDSRAAPLRALPDDTTYATARRAVADLWPISAATTGYTVARAASAAAHAASHAAVCAANPLDATNAAIRAAARVWDEYFVALNDALNAGPQGEAWSVDVAASGIVAYQRANGLLTPATLHD